MTAGPRLAVCAPPVLVAIDFAVISVLAPRIRADLRLSDGGLGWLVSGYSLGYAACLLPAGRCADLLGARRPLLAGLGLFGAGAATVAAAHGAAVAIAARVGQGAGAALMGPAALSLLTAAGDPDGRDRAGAAYGLAVGLGFALGSLAAGALAAVASWRLGMALEAPVCLAVAAAVRRVAVPAPAPVRRPAGPAALLGVGALVVAGALGGGSGHPAGGLLAAAAAGALLAFAGRLGRALTGDGRRAALACGVGAALTGTAVAATLALTLELQDARGESPLRAAGVLACFGAAAVPGARSARRLVATGGPGRLLAAGLAVQGAALLATAAAWPGGLAILAAGIAGFGFGHVLANAAAPAAACAGVPGGAHGLVCATLGAAQRLGAALGALLAARAGDDAAGLRAAVAASGACALAAAGSAWIGLRAGG